MKRLAFLGLALLAACGPMEQEAAQRLAAPAFMLRHEIQAGPYTLTAYERERRADTTATVYIEGSTTARNPVALHLAAMEPTVGSVVWLSSLPEGAGPAHAVYSAALDDLVRRYGFAGFEVVGYGTSAAVAAQLAAQRTDVVTLRTVAGALDAPEALTAARTLSRMPQQHFIGGQDATEPPAALHFYLQALGPTPCVRHALVPEATHELLLVGGGFVG
jgi:hypothetical protein